MNRQILSLMTAAMVLMAAFASCSKDNNSKKDDPGGGGGGGALEVNATVVDGNEYNGYIATAKALVNEDEYVAASGKYENGGFKLNLSGTVPEKYLNAVTNDFDEDFEGTISDRKAKIGIAAIDAYNSQGIRIGEFWWANENEDVWALYLYVDRNLTIKGRSSYYDDYYDEYWIDEADCSFTKGWNVIYEVEKGRYEYLLTTKKPSGTTLRWYYYDWDWKKNSPTDRQHPFSKMRQCAQK